MWVSALATATTFPDPSAALSSLLLIRPALLFTHITYTTHSWAKS